MDIPESPESSLLGIGLYAVPEASRLTGIPQARLRRWLRGYTYRSGEAVAASAPVWPRQLPDIDGTLGLGFLDLMEARFIDAFRKADVPWRVIRVCAERARELLGIDHPFSSQRFRTDGRTIFAEVAGQSGEAQLLDLAKSQLAFARVIGPSLYAGIEFSDRDMPLRWWPLGRQTAVVIDPARSFGQPIVSTRGIPTAVLADAVAAEGSAAKVARLYHVTPQAVHAALRFEQRTANRLAA
ncbi:MAG: DUF433 domain-containing protein [Alphaproteobacteria bacterium]|nr:DUF433 domain-containing protein [Alphaproteobacteria bacterium]